MKGSGAGGRAEGGAGRVTRVAWGRAGQRKEERETHDDHHHAPTPTPPHVPSSTQSTHPTCLVWCAPPPAYGPRPAVAQALKPRAP